LVSLLASSCHPVSEIHSRTLVRIASGPPEFYPFAEGLATAYRESLPNVQFEVHRESRVVATVEAIQRGEVDVGFTLADVAYSAFFGQLDGASEPFDQLRGIAVLQPTPLHLLVRKDSTIRQVSDLRGRHVGIGTLSTGTARMAGLLLQAFNLDHSVVHTEQIALSTAIERVIEGTLDAAFYAAMLPNDVVAKATRAGARLIAVAGPQVDRLRFEHSFLRAIVIPAQTYPGHPDAIRTIETDNLLVCRKDLDEALVYALTKRFFDVLPSLASSHAALRFIDLDQAPATPIPLHQGAAHLYRERELLR
jgi:TRAP transporter TAXI family solute receptor